MILANTPLNRPEDLSSMPTETLRSENLSNVEGNIQSMPELAKASVEQVSAIDQQNLQIAEASLEQADAPLSGEEQFIQDIYNLIIEDTFFSRLQEESKKKFLNDFNKFVREQIIMKQIDKHLDQERISDMLFNLYLPYTKKISWAHLLQDAFNDAAKLIKYLKDK